MANYNSRPLHLKLVECAAYLLLLGAVTRGADSDNLSLSYYEHSCPGLEVIVKNSLLPIFITDPQSPSAFLRLLFHDCQVQGCDASILLDSDDSRGIASEMEASKNFGIRGREGIARIKSIVEALCPGQVSCADILALAAREAVAYSGGPRITIPLGRKDSTTASRLRADEELPSPNVGLDGAMRMFRAEGMNVEETVAIMGAHSIGVGHCVNIAPRLYDSNVRRRDSIDFRFRAYLSLKCPAAVPITNFTFVANDLTNLVFDNQYYRDVMSGRGLFTVDSAIAADPRTTLVVSHFAEDESYFFQVFSSAFAKLSSLVNPEGGEIRRQCNRVN